MPKKPSKRKKTKRSKEVVSVLKNLTKAFVNLTEIEKQKTRHSKKHSTEKSSHKRSERRSHISHRRSERRSYRSHRRSERSLRSHRRSERRTHHTKPTTSRRRLSQLKPKPNILQPNIQKRLSKDLQIHPKSNKISPIKIREKKKTKKMNIFNLDKKTFINQAKILENIKKTTGNDKKYNKYIVNPALYKQLEKKAKENNAPAAPTRTSPVKAPAAPTRTSPVKAPAAPTRTSPVKAPSAPTRTSPVKAPAAQARTSPVKAPSATVPPAASPVTS